MQENLETMFSPQSVAVVGASRKEGSIGRAILKNIIDFNFQGTVYPINPSAKAVYSIKAYPDLKSLPEPVDLVIIVVPAKYVKGVVQEAAEIGAKACVIITAGFKEIGPEGAKEEEEIAKIAREANIRLVGPNCMGIIHGHGTRLNATFAPQSPIPGKIGFISQSGALGVVVIEYATQLGLGFSKFVSLGNKADVNATDMIENLGNDPNTDVILAYLESFTNPWNFSEIARKTSKKKPIIIVKSGRTAAGARAASSHTGALATAENALSASLSSAGVVRVSSVEELFDCAMAFSKLNLPKGPNVCIVTNAGGPGTLTTDALISQGLKMAELNEDTKKKLAAKLPHEASVENPIDVIASGGPEEYAHVLETVLADENVDSVIVIFVPPIMINPMKIVNVIEEAIHKSNKPILGCVMGRNNLLGEIGSKGQHFSFPMYQFPESAVLALRALTSYAMWRQLPEPVIEKIVEPAEEIRQIIPTAMQNGQENLTQEQVKHLFEGYGFKFPRTKIVESLDEAVQFVETVGFPIVVKMGSELVEHKTEEGGVYLDLRSNDEFIEAWRRIQRNYDRLEIPEGKRQIVIQEYLQDGVEMALGINLDPQFGPIIMVGSGGILIEVLDDVQFGLVPVSREDARNMIRQLKGYPLLLGYRGDNPVDLKALEDAVLKLSQLASENRDIKELDINPLLVFEVGHDPVILDARVRLRSE